MEVRDPQGQEQIPTVVLYPAESPESTEQIGPYTLNVAIGASIADGTFPLVLVSHGTGGSHLVYRDLARYLAVNGFVVALPEHPRNNKNNNDLANTASILENRPRHIRAVTDCLMSEAGIGPNLVQGSVGIIGHSLGGYTALALAGGVPTAFPHETADHQARRLQIVADERVKALVLLAPATAWFMAPGALRSVNVPILMFTAERDSHAPRWHGEIIKHGVDKTLVQHRSVPKAGHFSFLSPFPSEMVQPGFPPSQDPPGFDRSAFHVEMNSEILAFLRPILTA